LAPPQECLGPGIIRSLDFVGECERKARWFDPPGLLLISEQGQSHRPVQGPAHQPTDLAKLESPEAFLLFLHKVLEPGDVLIVTRLDRLARSTRDLLNVLDAVAKREAEFKSLKDTWADTTTPHGRLMLTVLGGLAEFERELIRARTSEGRERAKERGVRFGRPRKLTAHQRREALARLAAGETQADVGRSYNVDATTIGRLQAG
jgi:hypothetical protein